ncbi:MAG: fructosamine kinase [Anaerolineaceae bacterium]|nr:fructosamine kinase [Anaerolineaceae bacterium]
MRERIEAAIGQPIQQIRPLHGGMVAEVAEAQLEDGSLVVFKLDSTGTQRLDIEGHMLTYLKTHSQLPVPDVLYSSADLLILSHITGRSQFTQVAERHAAELLVLLHNQTQASYGLAFDTLIGKLHQPNTEYTQWISFFRDMRLLHMARVAYDAHEIDQSTMVQIHQLASKLDDFLIEPSAPSLIHGDIWTTNVLADGDTITGFVDPAIYYGHSEMELAYIAWTGTFSNVFFNHYHQLRPIEDGFFEIRMAIYNLYPTLVHVRHFGGPYESMAKQTLRRFL